MKGHAQNVKNHLMKRSLLIVFSALLCSNLTSQELFRGEKCILSSGFIYQIEDVDFPSCHASTIAEIQGGFIAAWFGGTEEGNPDVGIWISRLSNGKWSRPEEIARGIRDNRSYPCWNPVLYNTGDEILLFFKVGPSPSKWWGELCISYDGGISWTPPERLPENIIGPVKNKPVALENGTLLCPSSSEDDGWRVHMEMTADKGITWQRTEALNEKNIAAIQPAVLVHKDGKLQIVCRSKQSKILTSWSDDNGVSWTGLTPLHLPNPNSGIDAVTLSNGKHVMIYNHLSSGRGTLNVAVSDDGISWEAAAVLENDAKETEYSYPAVIQSQDKKLHITYTWNRKLIKHVVIDPSLIESRKYINGDWPTE